MNQIFGRGRELVILDQLFHSKKPEFLAIYGRRRVGKTFLIREFFRNKGTYFALTGVKDASIQKQLKNFVEEFGRVFGLSKDYKPPKTWFEAFAQLRKAIAGVKDSRRIILFFDELPWLATQRSGFLQDFDHFWNRYMSEDNRIFLVVCGSAASWMIRKIIRNKGGLYGRLTAQIRLLPFDLKETEEFLRRQGVALNRKAIMDIYMAIGGVPKYLSYVQKGRSAQQIVGQLCFNGPLENEFDELYASLFTNHTRHVQIIKALSAHPGGLTKVELANVTSLSAGGGMNLILDELEQSGFILTVRDFGKQKKDIRFKLVDEYSLFHLKWAAKASADNLGMRDDTFWTSAFNSPAGLSWAGYAFENLCLKHLQNIKQALGISGVITSASGWTYQAKKGSKEEGAQIDLVIDRADNCINLCEMKYANTEIVIDKALDRELARKRNLFLSKTSTKKSLFLTLISPFGIRRDVGHFDAADAVVVMDDLFG